MIALSIFGASFGTNPPKFNHWLFCFFFGSIAISNGIRAMDNIRLPHKRRVGKEMAWVGVLLGVIAFFTPMVLFSWSSTVGMEHVLDNNRVSFRPIGSGQRSFNSVLGKLSQASAAFDKSKEANGYIQLLNAEQIRWRYYHPVKLDPIELNPDFHLTFMNDDFDDSAWKEFTDSGDGIGYGDDRFGFKLSRPDAPVDRRTAYLRTRFETDVPLKRIAMQVRMDDGLFVYLDGKLLWTANMPKNSKEGYYTMATRAISDADEVTKIAIEKETNIPAGPHVLSISLHNTAASSDLGVQRVMLFGLPADAPDPAVEWWNVGGDSDKTKTDEPESEENKTGVSSS